MQGDLGRGARFERGVLDEDRFVDRATGEEEPGRRRRSGPTFREAGRLETDVARANLADHRGRSEESGQEEAQEDRIGTSLCARHTSRVPALAGCLERLFSLVGPKA